MSARSNESSISFGGYEAPAPVSVLLFVPRMTRPWGSPEVLWRGRRGLRRVVHRRAAPRMSTTRSGCGVPSVLHPFRFLLTLPGCRSFPGRPERQALRSTGWRIVHLLRRRCAGPCPSPGGPGPAAGFAKHLRFPLSKRSCSDSAGCPGPARPGRRCPGEGRRPCGCRRHGLRWLPRDGPGALPYQPDPLVAHTFSCCEGIGQGSVCSFICCQVSF